MTDQQALFDDGPAGVTLTERQAFALNTVSRNRDGLRADEVGAYMHERREKHPADVRCDWCSQEGNGVLGELRRKGLVIRRRGGLWQTTSEGRAGSPDLLSAKAEPAPYDPATAEIPF